MRQFRKLPQLSKEEKILLSAQLKNVNVIDEKKKVVIKRYRDRYYKIEDSLEDDFLLGLSSGIVCPPLLMFAIAANFSHSDYMNARMFCDDELKKY